MIGLLLQLQLIVANQQSASASVLRGDSMVHMHVGNGPHEAAISPDGKIGVISIYGDRMPGNQIAVIDLASDSVIRTIDLGNYRRPHGMHFLSNTLLASTSEMSRNVVLVDVSKGAVVDTIPTTQRGSHMVAFTADLKHAYTSNVPDNTVSELDVVGRKFVRTFSVPNQPEGITVLPNGSEVWVGSNTTGKVSIIDTKSGEITHTLEGIKLPYRLGAAPNGKLVAIVDGDGNKLFVADVKDHKLTGSVDLVAPRGVSITRDSKLAYVTLEGGSVAVVDLGKLAVIKMYAVQASPDGVAVR